MGGVRGIRFSLGEPSTAVVTIDMVEPLAQRIAPLGWHIQQITVFAAGLHTGATAPDAAQALTRFFKAPAAAPVIRKTGMEPA